MVEFNRLMLFPAEPGRGGGYSIAVAADLARLQPSPEDLVLFQSESALTTSSDIPKIPTNKPLTKALNVVCRRSAFDISSEVLKKLILPSVNTYQDIFSGEIIFYRALREFYPEKHIWVRFHNFFSLAKYRQSIRKPPTEWKLRLNFNLISRVECEVLSDPNVSVIFITEEDLSFAKSCFPMLHAECWPVVDVSSLRLDQLQINPPKRARLLFLGTASPAHTAVGLHYFCNKIFPLIRASMPECEFHLFGSGTESYSKRSRGIIGHGRFEGEGLPFDGDGLFIVPDTHGCGIKLKIADLLKTRVPFISTPFGMSGYKVPVNSNILIEELNNWPKCILKYFQNIKFDN